MLVEVRPDTMAMVFQKTAAEMIPSSNMKDMTT